jgi:glycosyltransferase involved in cell wall biosynthesis
MTKILIQAWRVTKIAQSYYLPYTHKIYLDEIFQLYDVVYLVSPVSHSSEVRTDLHQISGNLKVIELGDYTTYAGAFWLFPNFYNAYKKIKKECLDIDVFYTRSPSPYGWLQRYFFKEKFRIVHYVGDPVDTIVQNKKINILKKGIYCALYLPEKLLYLWACRGAVVKTNGFHLQKKLNRSGIKHAEAEISSTLKAIDFNFPRGKSEKKVALKFLYVGYLRKAKGIDTILEAFKIFQFKYPESTLTIVGSGEFDVHSYVELNNIDSVTMLGHIECRVKLNKIFSEHDVFCFASLSEGSPRVVLEAMANGLCVVSTPVGSLPYIFIDKKEILFATTPNEFYTAYQTLMTNDNMQIKLREDAFNKVKEYTLTAFIKKVFIKKGVK